MVKIIEFKNGHLDCYSKSIKDFIKSLRDNIQEQIVHCKNNKNYINYLTILDRLEKDIKDDDFIKSYFNNSRDSEILRQRKVFLEKISDENGFLRSFKEFIIQYNFNMFDLNNSFLEKSDFFSEREKIVENYDKLQIFDEVLVSKKGNMKIYLEYKSRRDSIFICFFLTDVNLDESIIYDQLQNYSKYVVENTHFLSLLKSNKENYYYIKIPRIYNEKEKIDFRREEDEISEKIIEYLNDELAKHIISNKNFINFLESFIPVKKELYSL